MSTFKATTGIEPVCHSPRDPWTLQVFLYEAGSEPATKRMAVDADVYAWAKHVRWHLHKSDTRLYAAHNTILAGRNVRCFLHRVILGLAPGDSRKVDHLNGNTLDNRRENLRVVTAAQNAQNQGSRGGSSKYRGVTWDRSRGKWMATAMLDGHRWTIGRFDSEDDAGAAAAAWRVQHMPFSLESSGA